MPAPWKPPPGSPACAHDFPEHFKAGLKPYAVRDKYYFARRPEITRVVDITNYVDKKVDANRANVAKGLRVTNGSRLKAELAKKNIRLPLLDGDDVTADRNYIREFVLARNRELGKQMGCNTPKRSTTSVRALAAIASTSTSASMACPCGSMSACLCMRFSPLPAIFLLSPAGSLRSAPRKSAIAWMPTMPGGTKARSRNSAPVTTRAITW